MATLKQNEQTIADAEYGFVAKGKALAEIRDKVQFQRSNQVEGAEKITFEGYLTDRWDWSRRMADRLIAASRVAVMAEQVGVTLANEGQAREVADLSGEPELLTEILTKALDSKGRITAAAIRKVRHKLAAVARNELGPDSTSSEADGQQGTLPDDDPNQGEDWEKVLSATRTVIRKTVREVPDNWQAALAQMLEDVAATSRKKAIRIAKHADSS